MARKVTIGPKIGQGADVAVNVEFDDQQNPRGASVHVKVVLPTVEGEADDRHLARAAEAVKRLADRLSEEIAAGRYEGRSRKMPPDEDEEQPGG